RFFVGGELLGHLLLPAPETAGPERRGDVSFQELGNDLCSLGGHCDGTDVGRPAIERAGQCPVRHRLPQDARHDQLAAAPLLGIAVVGDKGTILSVIAVLLLTDGLLDGGKLIHVSTLRRRRQWPKRPMTGDQAGRRSRPSRCASIRTAGYSHPG